MSYSSLSDPVTEDRRAFAAGGVCAKFCSMGTFTSIRNMKYAVTNVITVTQNRNCYFYSLVFVLHNNIGRCFATLC